MFNTKTKQMHANFISRMREDTSQSRASRGFTKLWRLLQRKRHINIELCVRSNLSDYSKLMTLLKISEDHFRLLGRNDFYVNSEDEKITNNCLLSFSSIQVETFLSLREV